MELNAGIAERVTPQGDSRDAQFRLLVEHVSDYAIFLLDRTGRVASWNPGAERIKGYAAADIVGRHFSVFYTPEDRAAGKPDSILRRAEAEGRVGDQGWRQRRDGSRFWADVIVTALRGRDGRLTGFAKITRDMTDARAAEAALRAAAHELQALTRRLVQAEEVERRRIAMELHDRVGQNLSALNINLDIGLAALEGKEPALEARLRDSLALVDATLSCIENVMAELRPPLIEEYGLGAALRWHGEEFTKRTGIAFLLEDRARERGVRQEVAIALFRIAQEALSNVAKHARAAHVRVALAEEGAELVLTVADDGAGFDAAAASAGRWGMTTMRERALAVGGRLDVASRPGRGTTLVAKIPLA